MGSVIENEKTKEKCQIFTPDDIVKSMLDHLGYSDHLYGKTILEIILPSLIQRTGIIKKCAFAV